ncbi:MAG: UDP-glucuronic acid decarboxylase family protein [candidate division WOR-3 bacterium]
MRILITGVCGFIGSHLAERFLREGNEVFGIDNFLTGKKENLEILLKYKNFNFEKNSVENFKKNEKFDLIIHLASCASPKDYLKYPLETMSANSIGTWNLLEISKKLNARFLYGSTSEVYGDPLENPQKEEYYGNVNPVGERSVYDESKRFGEALCMAYYRKFKLDVRIVRIFNTYGPRMKMDDGRVIPNFITQALRNEDLTIYGDGNQTRSFCYIDDLVEGIYRFSLKEKVKERIINLGNPEEIKIIDVAEIILKLIGSNSKMKFYPLPKDDPKRRCPDIEKAKIEINFEPRTELIEGLKKTIEYFKNIL